MLNNFLSKGFVINLLNILLQLFSVIVLYKNFNLDILGSYYLLFGASFFLSQLALLGIFDLLVASKEEIEIKFLSITNFLYSYFTYYILIFLTFIFIFFVIYKIDLNLSKIIFIFLFSINYYLTIFLRHINQFWFAETVIKILPSLLIVSIIIISNLNPISVYNISGFIILILQISLIKKKHTSKNLLIKGTLKYTLGNLKFFYTNILDNLNNYIPVFFLGYFTSNENIAIWNILSNFYRALSFHSDIGPNFFRFKLRNHSNEISNHKDKLLNLSKLQFLISILLSIGGIIIIKHILRILNVDEFIEPLDIFYLMPFIACTVIFQTIILVDFYYSSKFYVTNFIILRTVGIFMCFIFGYLLKLSLVSIFLSILILRVLMGAYSTTRFFKLFKTL